MRYTVTIDRKLTEAARKATRAKLREAGLETYKYFQGNEAGAQAAQKYAALLKQKYGAKMEVAQLYPVGFSVI